MVIDRCIGLADVRCNYRSINPTHLHLTLAIKTNSSEEARAPLYSDMNKMSKLIWQRAASPPHSRLQSSGFTYSSFHRSRRRIHSSAAGAGQANDKRYIHPVVRYMLYQKLSFHVEIGTPFNTRFIELSRVCAQNGFTIGSATFAQLTRVPTTQTTYLPSTCGRYGPKN